VVQDSDNFIPLAFIDGKQHKLGSMPSEAAARRIADVARHALAIIYGKPQGNPVFSKVELSACACIRTNYALGWARSRGRPNKSAGRAAGQTTNVHPITSQDVLNRLGELIGQPAPTLPEPDQAKARQMILGGALGHLTEVVEERLWTIREPDPPPPPTASPDPREMAERTAARKIEAWYREQRELYRAADLLTDESERMLSRIARQSYRTATGQPIAPEMLADWVAEPDAHLNPMREILDRPPWFHPQFYTQQGRLRPPYFQARKIKNFN
jgi:hypothetical protein